MTNLISIYLNLCLAFAVVSASDWAEWRGPARDGISSEKNLPAKWSPTGENLAWKAPYGGRSAPIVLGNHVYLQNTAGKGETEQERLMCFNADTGKLLWERSLGEDFGLLTTHGGRTVSPIIDGDLLIVSGVTFVWGEHGRGAHRFMAFDKRTGETVWVSAPGGRPYDTTYATPIIAEVGGSRLLIQGTSDG